MKMHEFLDQKSKWTQGWYAKDSRNRRVSPWSLRAVSWCILGAASQCYTKSESDMAFEKLGSDLGGKSIQDWNDEKGRTFEEVHALLLKHGV